MKARLISLTISLSFVAFSLQGFAHGLQALTGAPCSWFDGH